MSESTLRQEQTVQLTVSMHSSDELLPQFRAECAPEQSSYLLDGPQMGQMVQMEQGSVSNCSLSAGTAAPQQQAPCQQQSTQLMQVGSGQRGTTTGMNGSLPTTG